MKISFKDFWPGEHMFAANLASMEVQVTAANKWIAESIGIDVINVETLFKAPVAIGWPNHIDNVTHAYGIRVWYRQSSPQRK